eukprot:5839152-Amphidinium_carterae.1
MELTQEVKNLLENYDEADSPEQAGDDLDCGEDASMRDAREEQPRPEPTAGEQDVAEELPSRLPAESS